MGILTIDGQGPVYVRKCLNHPPLIIFLMGLSEIALGLCVAEGRHYEA